MSNESTPVSTRIIGQYRIQTTYSDTYDLDNPREWSNVGKMICFHRRYRLGDRHDWRSPQDFLGDMFIAHATDAEKRAFILERCRGNIAAYRELTEFAFYLGKREARVADMVAGLIREGLCLSDIDNRVTEGDLPAALVWLPLYLYDHGGITMNTTGFSCRWDSGQVGWIYATPETLAEEGVTDGEACLRAEVEAYDQYLRGEIYDVRALLAPEGADPATLDADDMEEVYASHGYYDEESAFEAAEVEVQAHATKAHAIKAIANSL